MLADRSTLLAAALIVAGCASHVDVRGTGEGDDAGTGAITVEAQSVPDVDAYGALAFNPADPGVIYLGVSSERPGR